MMDALMQEFQFDIETFTLIPSDGGRFEVEIEGDLVYSKLATKRHAEADEIRELVQARIEG
jgi:selenoprotein W-related protein